MNEIKQNKITSPYVYYYTEDIVPYARTQFSKINLGKIMFELYSKTPPYAAAVIDYKDITVCCAGEACRSFESFKKNVVLMGKYTDEEVIDVLEKLKERKYIWYKIEKTANGTEMIHYFLLKYPVGDSVIFKFLNYDAENNTVFFKIRSGKWTRKGTLDIENNDISIEKLPKSAFSNVEYVRSIYNAKPDEKIAISREIFNNRTNSDYSESPEKILFSKSKGFESFFEKKENFNKTLPLDESEAFWDLLASTVFRDIFNPASYLAPSFIVGSEFILTEDFLAKRWKWDSADLVARFLEKHKEFFVRQNLSNGEAFILFAKKYRDVDCETIFPGDKYFEELFVELFPPHILNVDDLKKHIKSNADDFVQKYFFLGNFCEEGNAKENFNKYIFLKSKNYKNRK